MTSKTLRHTVAAVMTALIAGLIVVGAPSSASAAKVRVINKAPSISVSDNRVERGATVRIAGRTTVLKRAMVVQKFSDGRWKRVKQVPARGGRYTAHVRVSEGVNRFRVVAKYRKVHKRLVLKQRASRVVRVTGVRPTPPVVVEPETPVVVPTTPDELRAARMYARSYINDHRESVGLATFFYDNTCLHDFAANHSTLMASNEMFEHSDSPLVSALGGASFNDACKGQALPYRGEVIALVHASTPKEAARAAVDAWIASGSHRAALEESSFANFEIGLGFVKTSDNYYWVTGSLAFN